MRATGIDRKGAASFEDLKPACQVLILHEDFSTYSRAVEVCRRIMEQFASELDFDIKCWNFIELADPNCARHAAKTASVADIILISLVSVQSPRELECWVEQYMTLRNRAEGVLALIFDNPCLAGPESEMVSLRIEGLASRLGMDFIMLPPEENSTMMDPLPATIMPRRIAP